MTDATHKSLRHPVVPVDDMPNMMGYDNRDFEEPATHRAVGFAVVYSARAFYPGTRKARHLARANDLGRGVEVRTLCGHPAVHIVLKVATGADATCPICRSLAGATRPLTTTKEGE